jgi:hypothetical protein
MTSVENPTTEYTFGSFLEYRDALHLARWVQGLLTLNKLLSRGGPISENICWGVGSSARHIAPQIRPAGQSELDFKQTVREEERRRGMSKKDLEESLEQEARDLRAKIDSGEIDIWDDSPVWVDRQEVIDFVSRSLDFLDSKIKVACNEKTSLVEKLIKEGIETARNGEYDSELYATLILWDYARMYHEGEPPYKVVFSEQVATALGIDPTLESIKMQKMRPLARRDFRRLKVAEGVIKKKHRWLSPQELSSITSTIDWG